MGIVDFFLISCTLAILFGMPMNAKCQEVQKFGFVLAFNVKTGNE